MSASARSPARWLAPLALLACALAVYLIVHNGLNSGSAGGASTQARPAAQKAAAKGKARHGARRRRASRRRYTVQPGDTLSAIADKTGVPLARIQQLNPTLDSQSLQTGQKVKLRP